jgi:hypothetical protein
MGKKLYYPIPFLSLLLLEAVFSRSIDPHSCWYGNGRNWCVTFERFDAFLWESSDMRSEWSLYMSVLWNTGLYLVEWAISFLIFSWICCLFNFVFCCHFLNFKAKWDMWTVLKDTWSRHAVEINENSTLLHLLDCPWYPCYSFPKEMLCACKLMYANEVEVVALHIFPLDIICIISWKRNCS